MKTMSPLFSGLLFSVLFLTHVVAQSRDDRFWLPNNDVRKVIVDDARDLVIVGGGFDYFGPYTGFHAVVNPSTGIYDPSFPIANESVDAAISDGAGGVYIGGSFNAIGATSRNFLAHIDASGIVTGWNPNPDGAVLALALHNGVLYVGGSFSTIAGESRSNIAAFDASTGNLLTSWVPDAISGEYYSSIETIVPYGGKVYIVGNFNEVNATTRNNIAALSMEDGGLLSWNPAPTHWADDYALAIRTIIANGAHLFVGGNFTNIGGENRRNIAHIDTTDGTATAWDAEFDPYIFQGMMGADTSGFVSALALKGDTLYVGGHFTGFQSESSPGLAGLNTATAAFISGAAPVLPQYQSVTTLFRNGTTMYVGGYFKTFGGQERKSIASFNVTTAALSSWNPKTSDVVNTIAIHDDGVYLGGYFYSVNGEVRNGLAAMKQSTAELTSWNPNAATTDDEFSFSELLLVDTTLYVGGRFREINGNSRTGLGAVGIAGGAVLPFAPEITKMGFSGPTDIELYAMDASSTTLFIGGSFDTVNSAKRSGAAAFWLADGSLKDWDPDGEKGGAEPAEIYALAVAGSRVFLGGNYISIKDSSRNNLAAVDTGNAAVSVWNPDVDGNVYSLKPDGISLYFGGSFSSVNGSFRSNVAQVDTLLGLPTSWDPNSNSSVDEIAVTPTNVYVVGFFDEIGGQTRYSAAALDKNNGDATDWDPQLEANDMAGAIAVSTAYQRIYIGGGFNTVMNEYSEGFGVVDNPYDPALPVELVSFTAQQQGSGIELTWTTATERNNHGFEIERSVKGQAFLYDNANGQSGRNSPQWENIGFVEGNGTTNASNSYAFVDKNGEGNISYRLKQIDRNGSFTYSHTVEFRRDGSPAVFALDQNFPNPFNPTTTIKYSVPVSGIVTLKVYDLLGKEVASLVNEAREAGSYTASFDASLLSTGVYFYRLTAGHLTSVKKLMVVK